MKSEHKDVDKILPHGELLRSFLNQSLIRKTDINKLLRNRGVFYGDNSKELTVPFLCNSYINPSEFEELKVSFNTKEDSKKTSTVNLKLENKIDITKAIPDSKKVDELVRKINLSQNNYKIGKRGNFINQNGEIEIQMEIVRYDFNKSWVESTNRFECSMKVFQDKSGTLRFHKKYTSKESLDCITHFQKLISETVNEKGLNSKKSKPTSITFGDFTNESRLEFYLDVAKSLSKEGFYFEQIVDVNFKATQESLPSAINWMEKKHFVNMRGDELDADVYFRDKTFYPYLVCWGLEAILEFDTNKEEGSLRLFMGFPDYERKGDKSKFELSIPYLSSTNERMSSREREILKSQFLEKFAHKNHELFAIHSNSA